MSETAPRSNPRLENFETNKAAAEAAEAARHQEAFENELYGEAGQGDNPENYTEESLKRIQEADAYERHMEEMAKRPTYEPGSADEIRARVQDMYDLDGAPSRAYDLERDTADEMNEAFDERIRAEGEALDRKLSTDPALRFMDNISREIAELKATEVDEDTDEEAINARIAHLEEVLNVRLERYEASEGFDPAVADYLMDRDDAGARKKAAVKALAELEAKADVRPTDDELDTDGKKKDVDPTDDDLEDDDAKKPDVLPTDEELESDDEEKKGDTEPTDEDLEDDEEKKDDVKPTDEELDKDDTDKKDDVEPTDEELEEDEEDEPEAEKKKWYKRLYDRISDHFHYTNEAGERKFSGKKATIYTLGLAAVAAVAVLTLKSGSDHSHLLPNSGPKGGDGIDAAPAVPVTPAEVVVPGADLPPSTGFDYPWDWATQAFGAEHAMTNLHDLAAKAAENGHAVEWHGSGTHEWVEIDGNSNTKQVIDILRTYAK